MRSHASPIVWRTAVQLLVDAFGLVTFSFLSRSQLAAANLFLRKQLALYQERRVKPRRADDATRIALVLFSWLIDDHAERLDDVLAAIPVQGHARHALGALRYQIGGAAC